MYSSIDDIKGQLPQARIIQLTDDEQLKPASIDAANPNCALIISRVNAAIASADQEINSYCGVKYSVPFATVPDEVKRLSVEITVYNLHKRRNVPDEIATRYDKAISQLKDIAKGIKTLGIDPAPAALSEGQPQTNKTTSDRTFTRENMEGY